MLCQMIILIEKLLLKEHFLRLTGGGCHAPVGAHCVTKDNGDLRMVVLFGNDDCSRILRIEVTGTDSEAVGHEAARMLGLE